MLQLARNLDEVAAMDAGGAVNRDSRAFLGGRAGLGVRQYNKRDKRDHLRVGFEQYILLFMVLCSRFPTSFSWFPRCYQPRRHRAVPLRL